MSTKNPGTIADGYYNDSTNTAIIVILISFSCTAVSANLFAVISIARHSTTSITGVIICYLSSVELLHAIACGATTTYSYYSMQYSFEGNAMLCGFYAWLYLALRIMATLLVSLMTFDRLLLSVKPRFYVRTWIARSTRWALAISVFIISLALASVPLARRSFVSSPDARTFHCLFEYDGCYAVFYMAFHLVQALFALAALPWVFWREKRVDAKLSVLLVGEMAVCRKGRNVVKVRDSLRISRLVAVVVVVYHACSVLLPLLLLLRLLNTDYPPVLGIISIQLPTFGALFLPLIYGFTWKPYRRAYYSSVAFLCPSSQKTRPRLKMRSIHNPAFRESQDSNVNSILHTRGVALREINDPAANTTPLDDTLPELFVLNAKQLTNAPTTASDDVLRPAPVLLPRTTSFQERHLIMPSKFQNIFEIIDALSAPHRHAGDSSDSSSTGRASPDELDGVSSLGTTSPVKLKDVSVHVFGKPGSSFSDVDFSSIDISTAPYKRRKVDKVKLDSERNPFKADIHSEESFRKHYDEPTSLSDPIRKHPDDPTSVSDPKTTNNAKQVDKVKLASEQNSFKDLHSEERFRKRSDDTTSFSGPIRFTDLRKITTEAKSENFRYPESEHPERFTKYLASESYVNHNF